MPRAPLLRLLVAVLLSGLAAGTANAATNLVKNGDFQQMDLGWINGGNTLLIDGSNLYMTGGVIRQTIATVADTLYQLKFDYFGPSRGFSVQIDGKEFVNGLPTAQDWTNYAFNFKAVDAETELRFGLDLTRIDNISVTAAPGPIAGAGLPALVALAGLALTRRLKSGRIS